MPNLLSTAKQLDRQDADNEFTRISSHKPSLDLADLWSHLAAEYHSASIIDVETNHRTEFRNRSSDRLQRVAAYREESSSDCTKPKRCVLRRLTHQP